MLKNPEMEALLGEFRSHQEREDRLIARDGEPRLKVSAVASKAALFYEKVRYAVDNKDEHLLRRNAIERMLRRMLMFDYRGEKIAEALLIELIRAGYLPNDTFPERIIQDIDVIITKVFRFADLVAVRCPEHPNSGHWKKRMLHLCSSEIEEYLFPTIREEAMVHAFYRMLDERVVIEEQFPGKTREIQLYLCSWRSLFQSEPAGLFYRLWLMRYAAWLGGVDDQTLQEIAQAFPQDERLLSAQIGLPIGDQLLGLSRNDAIAYRILYESLKKEPSPEGREKLLSHHEDIEREARIILSGKYREEEKRISRSALQAIVYIFATKTILAIGLEVPYDMFIAKKGINPIPLLINIVFHPVLLFLVTMGVRFPKEANTERVAQFLNGIVDGGKRERIFIAAPKTSLLKEIAFGLYGAVLLTILFIILKVLVALHFNILGIGFFLLFLVLVSFFGYRIRVRAQQWVLSGGPEKAGAFFVDVLTLPIVLMGRWLIRKFDYANVMVFILDFIIETPYQLALDVIDSFSSLLKEKKDQLRT
jgi:hypothetical protein